MRAYEHAAVHAPVSVWACVGTGGGERIGCEQRNTDANTNTNIGADECGQVSELRTD